MALVDSLLTAMVQADGDALVMHVGERPIVIAGAKTIDLSNHGLNLNAMVGMLGQLLPHDAQSALQEYGAIEHRLPPLGDDQFSVVAARGGDDIWIEIRRRRDVITPEPAETVPVPAGESVSALQAPSPLEAAREQASVGAVVEAARARAESPAFQVEEPAAQDPPVPPGPGVTEERGQEPAVETPPPAMGGFVAAAAMSPPPTEPAPPSDRAVELPAAPTPVEIQPEPGESQPATATEASAGAASPVEGTDDSTTPVAGSPAATDEPLQEPASDAAHETAAGADAPAKAVAADTRANGVELAESALRESRPVPAMASVRTHEYAATESSIPMPTHGAVPRPDAPAGGPPPNFTTPATPLPSSAEPSAVMRTVRIEVPSRATSGRAQRIEQLLRTMTAHDVTELFLISQSRPYVRTGGDIRVLEQESALQPADVEGLLAELTPEPWRDVVRRGQPAEWLVELTGVGRVRCTAFHDHRGPGAIFRRTATHVLSAEQLGLGPEATLMATEPEGLVVVAGPSGADRSSIVAAFVDTINQRRSDYIITLERQVGALHDNRHALVSQRGVGADRAHAIAVARAALRENPDVLVIEDVASPEMAGLALEAASGERLVIVSIEASSTGAALQRLVDLLPAQARAAARTFLARVFRGAIAQLLVRKASGGRTAVREQLAATREVSTLIADDAVSDLAGAIESRRDSTPIVDVLVRYVREGAVDVREAFRKAPDRDRLLTALRAASIDTANIDRLA